MSRTPEQLTPCPAFSVAYRPLPNSDESATLPSLETLQSAIDEDSPERGQKCWELISGVPGIIAIAGRSGQILHLVQSLAPMHPEAIDDGDLDWFLIRTRQIADGIHAAIAEEFLKRKHNSIALLQTHSICKNYVDMVDRLWAVQEAINEPELERLLVTLK